MGFSEYYHPPTPKDKCLQCRYNKQEIIWKNIRVCIMCFKENLKTQRILEEIQMTTKIHNPHLNTKLVKE